MRILKWCLLGFVPLVCLSFTGGKYDNKEDMKKSKVVVYQVFTRLFGNTKTNNKPWGTLEENGVGKFNDFTGKALDGIRELGVTHIWYTGVPHHALVRDYSAFGIGNDDPDVVKGRAGSPYAVKDYYNVNPDLAVDPARRLEEFKALVDRTHLHGMKVIIDIVPNHVARGYRSVSNPAGAEDFGASDDKSVEYSRNNNFYYIPGQPFRVPEPRDNYKPLGGESHPMADGRYDENPARWTGNGSRQPQPDFYDWYETIKINFGIRPDGTKDFDQLPEGFDRKPVADHHAFWKGKDVPDSWKKFRDIALYWISFGVDGFRFDMAEMVPVEFWSYLNSSIKTANPDAFLLAEVYNPSMYREYIHTGKMDYLYDKVELYDTLKHIIQGHGSADHLPAIFRGQSDIEHHLLHFLENHDEQRLASPAFAGNAERGKPAMVLSAAVSTSPTMIYFAQEVGEPGENNAGFGSATRTTIFDYWGVPSHQRWMNGGAFDGGNLTEAEKSLRSFYRRLLNLTTENSAFSGNYREIHSFNRTNTEGYYEKSFSFVRWSAHDHLVVVVNFKDWVSDQFELKLPPDLIREWNLKDGNYNLKDKLYGSAEFNLNVSGGQGAIKMTVGPLESFILSLESGE